MTKGNLTMATTPTSAPAAVRGEAAPESTVAGDADPGDRHALIPGSDDTEAGASSDGWRQLLLVTEQPAHVEAVLIDVAPLLRALDSDRCWWIRKDTTLRLRLRHPTPDEIDRITAAARQHGAHVHPGVYEPETHAFGGPAGIAAAHRMACRDAWHLAGHLTHHREHLHRHEVFLLLATRLMRAAGLDLEEQGDVWARIAAHRPPAGTVAASTRRSVRHLIFSAADTDADTAASPLSQAPAWSRAVETAGTELAALAATGQLTRGLRAVVTNLLLFMANRHGVQSRPLSALSTAAHHVIFQEDHHMAPSTAPSTDTTADTSADKTAPLDAAVLRDQLADLVRARGGFSGPDSPVERAFRTVSRHEFVPGHPARAGLRTTTGRDQARHRRLRTVLGVRATAGRAHARTTRRPARREDPGDRRRNRVQRRAARRTRRSRRPGGDHRVRPGPHRRRHGRDRAHRLRRPGRGPVRRRRARRPRPGSVRRHHRHRRGDRPA